MERDVRGPLAGEALPLHGGEPGASGCNGCTDCCHLPEISVTDDEAERLSRLHAASDEPLGRLLMHDDPSHPGWKIMEGPCVFRQLDTPLHAGGCRIYEERPVGCDIFTCAFLLNRRRLVSESRGRRGR